MRKLVIGILLFAVAFGYAQNKGRSSDLMPLPAAISYGDGAYVLKKDFSISIEGYKSDRLIKYSNRILRRIDNKTGIFFDQGILNKENVSGNGDAVVKVKRKGKLEVGEDESYSLSITEKGVVIDAETDFGAQYALETLYQLVDSREGKYVLPLISINDSPRFAWRGIMFDVARHFMPIGDLKRNIDLMASVKMNVFHWHLSDDQGFRVELDSHPIHKKGSDGNYYTKAQIRDIVKYAGDRGIRVIPEIDVPGHGTAILTVLPQIASKDTSYTLERNAGIFKPVLDPTNPLTYEVLDDVIREMTELFPDKYFHIGGDETEGEDWLSNPKITSFMKEKNIDNPHGLQAYFNVKLYDILKKYGKEMMGWEEIQSEYIPKSALIHSWRGVNEGMKAGESLEKAVKGGYRAILSNGFYIDLMLPAKSHYNTKFVADDSDLTDEQKNMILGGEATMWSELITPLTLDSRVWPRAAAIAEKFWSPKEKTKDTDDMYRRLDIASNRLEMIGSQHIRNQDVIIRNISNNTNTEAIKVLVDVCEPLKIYTRNPGGTMYKSYSPFTKFADACVADAKGAREFDEAVKSFISEKNEENIRKLKDIFAIWESNHSKVEKSLSASPILNEIEQKSRNLSKLGRIGFRLIEEDKIPVKDIDNALKLIDEMSREEGGRTELVVTKSMNLFIKSFLR
ncbi:MAG: family 20 glycosylhydrolase [Bacteroidota bacterium]